MSEDKTVAMDGNQMARNMRYQFAREAMSFADGQARHAAGVVKLHGQDSPQATELREQMKPYHNIIQGVNMVAACLPRFPQALKDAPETVEMSRDTLLDMDAEIERLQKLTSYLSGVLCKTIQRLEWDDELSPEEKAEEQAALKAEREAILGPKETVLT